MRQDQFERMQALSETLTELFLEEGNPDNWPGKGILPMNMDRDTRGDRFWCKRNAVATISIVMRAQSLIGTIQSRGTGTTPAAEAEEQDSDLETEVASAEKEGARLLAKIQKATRGK